MCKCLCGHLCRWIELGAGDMTNCGNEDRVGKNVQFKDFNNYPRTVQDNRTLT